MARKNEFTKRSDDFAKHFDGEAHIIAVKTKHGNGKVSMSGTGAELTMIARHIIETLISEAGPLAKIAIIGALLESGEPPKKK